MANTNLTITNDPPSVETLATLYCEVGWMTLPDGSKLQQLIDGTTRWWVARDGDTRVLGMGRCLTDWARCACIYDVIVVPDCQRQGIGTAIMRAILRDLTLADVDIIHLWPSKGKIPFYSRLGFHSLSSDQPVMKYQRESGE